MKPMKAAAVVAGSVMALGAATPAFAAEGLAPSSLTGAVDTLAGEGLRDAKPLHSNALDTENQGSVLNSVQKTADGLNESKKGTGATPLLGGLPLGR